MIALGSTVLMALLAVARPISEPACATCSAFPPYEQLDCSPEARQESGGFCLDRNPANTYCLLKAWIASHEATHKDYHMALNSERILRPLFGRLSCAPPTM